VKGQYSISLGNKEFEHETEEIRFEKYDIKRSRMELYTLDNE
jgi:hypothetical protein